MRHCKLSGSSATSFCVASQSRWDLHCLLTSVKHFDHFWLKKQCFYLKIDLCCFCGEQNIADNKTGTELALGVIKKKMNIKDS